MNLSSFIFGQFNTWLSSVKKTILIDYLVHKYENHSMTSSYDIKSNKSSGTIL